MKITGEFGVEMTGLRFSYTASSKLRLAHCQVTKRVDKKQAQEIFDPKLVELAFATMHNEGGDEGDKNSKRAVFGYSSLTPDIPCEVHQLTIAGRNGISVQPKVMKIVPVDDEEKVDITVELPISIGVDSALAGLLATKYCEAIEIKLDASQQQLPLTVVKKAGAFGNPQPQVV